MLLSSFGSNSFQSNRRMMTVGSTTLIHHRRSVVESCLLGIGYTLAILFLLSNCMIYQTLQITLETRSVTERTLRRAEEYDNKNIEYQANNHHPSKKEKVTYQKTVNPASATDKNLLHANDVSLRSQFEQSHSSLSMEDMMEFVESLRKPQANTPPNMPYDILNCPTNAPPLNYPMAWNAVREVLPNWNPENTTYPSLLYQGLCVFDWRNQSHRQAVQIYRQAELPFVLQNHPDVMKTAYRWNQPNYLETLLQDIGPQRNEHSTSNHFMFWRPNMPVPKGWKAPTKMVQTYQQWKKKALAMDQQQQQQQHQEETTTADEQLTQEHWYFRLNSHLSSPNDPDANNPFVYDELDIFNPFEPNVNRLFMVDPDQHRGINCRFGMKGVIAEAHYDSSRNWITLLGGQRRYILAHPKECPHMDLYPSDHPSARHSRVDWSNVTTLQSIRSSSSSSSNDNKHHPFAQAQVNEVVLQAGDALYLPTVWFHYIVSLNMNFQCNARSGKTTENHQYIRQCGFSIK